MESGIKERRAITERTNGGPEEAEAGQACGRTDGQRLPIGTNLGNNLKKKLNTVANLFSGAEGSGGDK